MTGRGQAVTIGGGGGGPSTITILLPGSVGPVITDITDTWIRVPAGGLDLTGALAHILAKVAPGGTAPSWDIMRSTNGGTSFATILPTGAANKLQLAVGSKTASLTPAWTVTTLDEDDLLRVDVVQTDNGTARNVRLTIELAD